MKLAPQFRPLLGAVLAAGLLAGCGQDTARTLGLTRDAPDEFQVMTRAPLSMPPSLGQLPPPRPGTTRPQERAAREQAEALLTGGVPGRPAAPTPGEAALLAQTGTPVPQDIRSTLDQEATRTENVNRTLVDRALFWRDPPPPGVPVDPNREAQRLRENAALGRPVVEGETPIIQPERRGVLENLSLDRLRFW
ncbi:DUF3035 domain-containing protein [Roseococcus thiosulfatophilus]|uniref:DUF3035 domain-containing protein n=1 Tax=Roseococcus thiosulfatophilus TaxID=35813 RepID=UPI001A8D63E0|nr:DUF3035 domain-containing protein [Roseococcus thiosulfatophilus]